MARLRSRSGRRLARLARSAQVLVVTHLAQVAAYADRQLVVRKSDDGAVTSSGIHQVESHDRVEELARMLGGDAELGDGPRPRGRAAGTGFCGARRAVTAVVRSASARLAG